MGRKFSLAISFIRNFYTKATRGWVVSNLNFEIARRFVCSFFIILFLTGVLFNIFRLDDGRMVFEVPCDSTVGQKGDTVSFEINKCKKDQDTGNSIEKIIDDDVTNRGIFTFFARFIDFKDLAILPKYNIKVTNNSFLILKMNEPSRSETFPMRVVCNFPNNSKQEFARGASIIFKQESNLSELKTQTENVRNTLQYSCMVSEVETDYKNPTFLWETGQSMSLGGFTEEYEVEFEMVNPVALSRHIFGVILVVFWSFVGLCSVFWSVHIRGLRSLLNN